MSATTKVSGITVAQLTSRGNESLINTQVSELLRNIDSKINEAHNTGNNKLLYELPDNFEIRNLTRKDAQLVIYVRIMQDLEQRGFTVYIYTAPPTSKKPFTGLIVSWMSSLSEKTRDEFQKYLAQHTSVNRPDDAYI